MKLLRYIIVIFTLLFFFQGLKAQKYISDNKIHFRSIVEGAFMYSYILPQIQGAASIGIEYAHRQIFTGIGFSYTSQRMAYSYIAQDEWGYLKLQRGKRNLLGSFVDLRYALFDRATQVYLGLKIGSLFDLKQMKERSQNIFQEMELSISPSIGLRWRFRKMAIFSALSYEYQKENFYYISKKKIEDAKQRSICTNLNGLGFRIGLEF